MTTQSIADIKFEPATPITIKLDPDKVKMWPLNIEADLLVEIGEASFMATAPLWALSEDFTTVKAACVGRVGAKIIVTFPATNLGTSIWHIPEDELPGILAG